MEDDPPVMESLPTQPLTEAHIKEIGENDAVSYVTHAYRSRGWIVFPSLASARSVALMYTNTR